jgi:FlaA1/EpsC-like NDP-sugar epimerase
MGEPVKIYDLAVSLIKLMGYEVDVDIPIKITGLRPGEKLYEEILMSEEGLTTTKNNKIFISNPIDISEKKLEKDLEMLKNLQYDETYSTDKVVNFMKKAVPTFKDPEEVNKEKK